MGGRAGRENTLPEPHYCPRLLALQVPAGPSFLDKMLSLADGTREVLKVVNDQRGNPTSTIAVAQALNELLRHPELVGTYHLTCEGEATWYDFACRIFGARARESEGDSLHI